MKFNFLKKLVVIVTPAIRVKWVRKSLWFIASFLLAIVLFNFWLFLQISTIYFALIGPITGDNSASGQAMQEAVELYIDRINNQGGIRGHQLALKIFDDRSNINLAKLYAQEIATDDRIIAVLGHYNSSTSLAASPIYQEYGIPVMTGSATTDSLTKENSWYFRTIFSNTDQAALMANYVYKTLNQDHASLVYIDDVFGKQLGDAFLNTANEIGLDIKNIWEIKSDYSNLETLQKQIIAMYKEHSKAAGLLYLATHGNESIELIVALKDLNKNIQIVGSDAITTPNFLEKLKKYPQERSRPGYYTEGIYATPPFLSDIAGLKAQQFQNLYQKTYQHPASTTASTYYDAILTFTEALQRSDITFDEPIEKQRKMLRQSLWNISGFVSAIEATTGSIYFDNHGDIVNIVPVGQYSHGRLIPALEQFQPLHDFSGIDNPLDAALNDQIIYVNNKFMHRTQVVYTGMDFIEISDLNIQEGTFVADFYLWFRFQHDFDDKNISFINSQDHLVDLGKPVISKRSKTKGQITRAYRVKEKFKTNFDFSAYPLDKQSLNISFRHQELTHENIIYVTDKMGMEGQGKTLLEKLNDQNSFHISGWFTKALLVFQNFQKTTSTLGLPERFDNIQQIAYSQFNMHLNIERHVSNFILKNLMPMIFLVVLAYMVFFMPDNAFGQKISLTVNTIIATSLFHLRVSTSMAHVDYIMLIEYIFYMIYFIALLSSVIVIKEHYLYKNYIDEDNLHTKAEKDKYLKTAKRLNLFGRFFFPSFIIIFISILLYIYR